MTANLQLSRWFLQKRPKTVVPKEQWCKGKSKNPEAKRRCSEEEKRDRD